MSPGVKHIGFLIGFLPDRPGLVLEPLGFHVGLTANGVALPLETGGSRLARLAGRVGRTIFRGAYDQKTYKIKVELTGPADLGLER